MKCWCVKVKVKDTDGTDWETNNENIAPTLIIVYSSYPLQPQFNTRQFDEDYLTLRDDES